MIERVGRKGIARKDTDDETRMRCAGGIGILREETWVDGAGNVVWYNLAFILPHMQRADHGRILGYDNRHGYHERHFQGVAEPVAMRQYEAIRKRFLREVAELRSEYESADLR